MTFAKVMQYCDNFSQLALSGGKCKLWDSVIMNGENEMVNITTN